MESALLKAENITKGFPGVQALSNGQLEIRQGEVHALLGENGAGKSTFMKILTGVIKKDSGKLFYKGKEVEFENPKHAQMQGISIIYQEFNLLPELTVAQNIFIGREPKGFLSGLINDKELIRKTQEVLESLHLQINPKELVKNLSVAEQQMVEIAKAISFQCEILIMDEPTAALTESEIDELFEVVHRLKANKVGIVYISHRLEELERIADRVTIMRDGSYISTDNYSDLTIDDIINKMVGRSLVNKFPKRKPAEQGPVLLEVKDVEKKGVLQNINFTLHAGEVLGISGLMGAGRTELARVIFGADAMDRGTVMMNGKPLSIQSPESAINQGIGYITEDRKKDGLALSLSVHDNIILANIKQFSRSGVVNTSKTRQIANDFVTQLKIKTPHLEQKVKFLSGGNQQKVVLAKWLCKDIKVLIFDEPTRGIDVGAKMEVYQLMHQLADSGVGIIMISSEIPEILGMSERILVMHEGTIAKELQRDEANQEKILYYATGGE